MLLSTTYKILQSCEVIETKFENSRTIYYGGNPDQTPLITSCVTRIRMSGIPGNPRQGTISDLNFIVINNAIGLQNNSLHLVRSETFTIYCKLRK